MSAEKLGSTRNVKSLLLKGANRQAVNKKGKTPRDMTKALEDQNLASQLVSMLQLQSYCECLMFRVPLVPLKRNHKTQALFMLLFGTVLILNLCIIIPVMAPRNEVLSVVSGLVTLFVFLAFFLASCKDAGSLEPMDNYNFMELLRDINPADLCPECQVIRTARSRHCAICN